MELKKKRNRLTAKQQKLIIENQGLVISIARRYFRAGVDFLDLVQEGNLGMIRAALKYDPKRPTKFATMATWWIKKHIREIVMKKYMVHIPFNVQIDENKETREEVKLHTEYGEELSFSPRANFEFLQQDADHIGYRQEYNEKIDIKGGMGRLQNVFNIMLSKTEQTVFNMYYDGKGPKEIREELATMRLEATKLAMVDEGIADSVCTFLRSILCEKTDEKKPIKNFITERKRYTSPVFSDPIEKFRISKQRISQIFNKTKLKLAKGITVKRKRYSSPVFDRPQVYTYLSRFYPHLRQQSVV